MTTFVLDPSTNTVASEPRIGKREPFRKYKDNQYPGGEVEWRKKLANSSTVYVGNLSCYTSEYQIYEAFSRCGTIKRIIIGLDKFKKTPCGFCFVEFDEREGALNAVRFLNHSVLDGRYMKVDIDAGFLEGRQFGRGSSGGQVSDDRRKQREQAMASYRGGYQNNIGGILTRSITITACITMISLVLISTLSEPSNAAAVVIRPTITTSHQQYSRDRVIMPQEQGRYISISNVRQSQIGDSRVQFEQNFAQFLVNIMKASKPSLMKAFIRASLADRQLRDISLNLFLNATNEDDDRR